MNRESRIVRFDHGIRNLWRRNNGEGRHHSIGVLLANLAEQKSTHTRTRASTKRMSDLETLKTLTSFGFTSNNIQNLID